MNRITHIVQVAPRDYRVIREKEKLLLENLCPIEPATAELIADSRKISVLSLNNFKRLVKEENERKAETLAEIKKIRRRLKKLQKLIHNS